MKSTLLILFCAVFCLYNQSSTQPSIITLPADSISASSFRLRAFVYSGGEETEVSFHIQKAGITCEFAVDVISLPQHISADETSREVSMTVTGLASNSVYHYSSRARPINRQKYITGNELRVTTLADPEAKGFAIPLFFKDQSGTELPPRKFGVHTRASYCLDLQLGECDLPPEPPTGPDFRFVNPISSVNSCFGLGTYQDLRLYRDSTQTDTFRIRFTPANHQYPVILSWPSLPNYYSRSVRLIDLFGGILINTDMKKQTADTITIPVNELLIVAQGPMNLIASNFDYWKENSVLLNGVFNAGGLSTDGWFEWGLTADYGNHTRRQYIGNEMTVTDFQDSLTDLLPGTIYHYRTVIQNEHGVVYGIDQPFETPAMATSISDSNEAPATFLLHQNYPNPFNPVTNFEFRISNFEVVSLRVYNILGQEIVTLVNGIKHPGSYTETWDASNVTGGVYFYRLTAGKIVETRKLVLIK